MTDLCRLISRARFPKSRQACEGGVRLNTVFMCRLPLPPASHRWGKKTDPGTVDPTYYSKVMLQQAEGRGATISETRRGDEGAGAGPGLME